MRRKRAEKIPEAQVIPDAERVLLMAAEARRRCGLTNLDAPVDEEEMARGGHAAVRAAELATSLGWIRLRDVRAHAGQDLGAGALGELVPVAEMLPSAIHDGRSENLRSIERELGRLRAIRQNFPAHLKIREEPWVAPPVPAMVQAGPVFLSAARAAQDRAPGIQGELARATVIRGLRHVASWGWYLRKVAAPVALDDEARAAAETADRLSRGVRDPRSPHRNGANAIALFLRRPFLVAAKAELDLAVRETAEHLELAEIEVDSLLERPCADALRHLEAMVDRALVYPLGGPLT